MQIQVNKLGRPRSEELHQAILDEALQQVLDVGFRAVSIESIAAQAGVGKTTIYRRWPNKAAVVMDAFIQGIGPGIAFPATPKATESIRLQMRSMARAFHGKWGALVKSIMGEAQFDAELAEAFRERWIRPRRLIGRATFEAGIRNGELRPDVDIETAIDALYGGIYYRLLTGSGPLNEAYVDELFGHVMDGLKKPID